MNTFVRIEPCGRENVAVFASRDSEIRANEYVCRMAADFERGRGRDSAEYDKALRLLRAARGDLSAYPLDHPGWVAVAEAAKGQP